jgi:GNAT superfamily N-acetyltransferase
LSVSSLLPEHGKQAGLLTHELFSELGSQPSMSVSQVEQLFSTPWLKNGLGFVLWKGREFAGYCWTRPSVWLGDRYMQAGLTVKHGFRDPSVYHLLTDRLLETVDALGREHAIARAVIHFRAIDSIHPPIVLRLGFEEHSTTMVGLRHDLNLIPVRFFPPEFSVRPTALPLEKGLLLNLSSHVFDDRARLGEPMGESYMDFESSKPGFVPEQVLFVEAGGEPVAYAFIIRSNHEARGSFEIAEIGVLPPYRGRGVGEALVCRCLEWIRTQGVSAAMVGTFNTNPASGIYWRLGFRPDKARTFRFFTRPVARV